VARSLRSLAADSVGVPRADLQGFPDPTFHAGPIVASGAGRSFNGWRVSGRGSLFPGRPSFSSVQPFSPLPSGGSRPKGCDAGARVPTCGRSDVLGRETRRSPSRALPQAFRDLRAAPCSRVDEEPGRGVVRSREKRDETEGGEALAADRARRYARPRLRPASVQRARRPKPVPRRDVQVGTRGLAAGAHRAEGRAAAVGPHGRPRAGSDAAAPLPSR
jgi:hypothetical protein